MKTAVDADTKTPKVIKVSGGRSSGMMLLHLLDSDALDPSRGDVAVFTNTSAEHRATYTFLRRLKILTERRGLPFFWLEFCTYEDAVRGDWTRRPAYRLVNERPMGPDNPGGYRHRGEVFEEMLSYECATPSIQARFCTRMMKVAPSNAFLSDWFGRGDGPKQLGHSGGSSRITDESLLSRHKKYRGQMPPDILLDKKRYVRSRPLVRPAQRFADFTSVSGLWRAKPPARLFGPKAIGFVSHLGIRADETHRLSKMVARIGRARSEKNRAWGDQPPGESVTAPLVEAGIDRKAVAAFWRSQNFNLELPPDGRYGNCVFCMMKGRTSLTELAKECPPDATGPESINWWAAMEARYGRDLIAERRTRTQEEVTHFGFFGPANGPIYAAIRDSASGTTRDHAPRPDAEHLVDESYDDCNCTD